jgi:hypothetical protein
MFPSGCRPFNEKFVCYVGGEDSRLGGEIDRFHVRAFRDDCLHDFLLGKTIRKADHWKKKDTSCLTDFSAT